jgi:hypothetical protein
MLRIDGVAVSAQMNLSKKIERAFAARPKPPQVRLADKVLQLDSDVEEALWFSGRDWHELTWQNWQEHSRAIFFFDPEAFGYYLPSVLLLAVENPSESLTAADSLISQLDRTPGMEGWTEGFASHFLGLNRAELDVLKEWLLQVCENDVNKQQIFYDQVPVGGKIRVFGSVPKLDPNPGHKLSKQAALDQQFSAAPDDLIQGRADNYHRWIGLDWAFIEKGGEANAGAWSPEKEQRLKEFIAYGHKLGYLVGVYCLDGFTDADNQGWDPEYNFGSHEAAAARWNAAVHAKADFISTDHYEQLAETLASLK